MPPKLADAVLAAPDAWNRGDLDAFMAAYHEDATFLLIGGFEGLAGREFHGREAIRGYFEDFREAFDRQALVVEQARWVGERMLVVQRMDSRARTGGVETTMRWGALVSYRDGLIARQENYYEVEDALAAAEISPAPACWIFRPPAG